VHSAGASSSWSQVQLQNRSPWASGFIASSSCSLHQERRRSRLLQPTLLPTLCSWSELENMWRNKQESARPNHENKPKHTTWSLYRALVIHGSGGGSQPRRPRPESPRHNTLPPRLPRHPLEEFTRDRGRRSRRRLLISSRSRRRRRCLSLHR
jgi:hypothetical protein